jgi:hypothetical protein
MSTDLKRTFPRVFNLCTVLPGNEHQPCFLPTMFQLLQFYKSTSINVLPGISEGSYTVPILKRTKLKRNPLAIAWCFLQAHQAVHSSCKIKKTLTFRFLKRFNRSSTWGLTAVQPRFSRSDQGFRGLTEVCRGLTFRFFILLGSFSTKKLEPRVGLEFDLGSTEVWLRFDCDFWEVRL